MGSDDFFTVMAAEDSAKKKMCREEKKKRKQEKAATGEASLKASADSVFSPNAKAETSQGSSLKPFWRVWNAAGSDGRGVIGVLEANFVEPAHDKQGFERTTVLSRLETRLIQMQKTYWSTNCHKVGYAPRINKRYVESEDNDSSPEVPRLQPSQHPRKGGFPNKVSNDSNKYQYSGKLLSNVSTKGKDISSTESVKAGITTPSKENGIRSSEKPGKSKGSSHLRTNELPYERNESGSVSENVCNMGDNSFSSVPNVSPTRKFSDKESNCPALLSTSPCSLNYSGGGIDGVANRSTRSQTKAASQMLKEGAPALEINQSKIKQLEDENDALKQRIKIIQESMLLELQQERDRNKTLVDQLEEKEKKLEEAIKEQEALIDIFSEERTRRDDEEATLRKKLKDARDEIRDLLEKLASTKSNSS